MNDLHTAEVHSIIITLFYLHTDAPTYLPYSSYVLAFKFIPTEKDSPIISLVFTFLPPPKTKSSLLASLSCGRFVYRSTKRICVHPLMCSALLLLPFAPHTPVSFSRDDDLNQGWECVRERVCV